LIRLDQVTMRFGATLALDRASFEVGRGEIVGLLGPNGAGKSTCMRIITTYLTPLTGRVTVAGLDPAADPIAVRRNVGYLPEVAPLYPDMQVEPFLRFVARARGVEDPSRLGWVVEACGLGEVLVKHNRELSRGFRQRVGLAQALLHDPEVLILDEPTAGLDPSQVQVIRALIRELAGRKTILFSTHVLPEAEAVTDRVIILHRGRILADGRVDELEARARGRERVTVVLAAEPDEARAALAELGEVEEAVATAVDGGGDGEPRSRLRITAAAGTPLADAVGRTAAQRGWVVHALQPERLTLEQTFLALIEGRGERS